MLADGSHQNQGGVELTGTDKRCWEPGCADDATSDSMYCLRHQPRDLHLDEALTARFGAVKRCRTCGEQFRSKDVKQPYCITHRRFG